MVKTVRCVELIVDEAPWGPTLLCADLAFGESLGCSYPYKDLAPCLCHCPPRPFVCERECVCECAHAHVCGCACVHMCGCVCTCVFMCVLVKLSFVLFLI